jgi:hypothetical protein
MHRGQARKRSPQFGPRTLERFWPVIRDMAIEIKSHNDASHDTVAKVEMYRERGSKSPSRFNPETRDVQPLGAPPGPVLDFDAIIDT